MPHLVLGLLLAASLTQGSPADVNARFSRAAALQAGGKLEAAEAEYREVVRLAPKYAEAWANLGAVLARRGRYDEAIKSYETALKLAPQLKPIVLNIGIAYYRRGDFARAVDSLKRFLAGTPGHAQATQLVALSLVELGRDEEAMTYLEPALTADPQNVPLLYATGLAALRLKRPMVTGAINALAEAPGGKAWSHLLRGQALLKNNRFENAVTELEAARGLDPKLPRMDYSLGLAYYKKGQPEQARQAFEAELKRTPRDVTVMWYLASLDEQEDKTDAALRRLQAALKIEPDSADVNALIGQILVAKGNPAEALKYLEVSVAKDPTDIAKRLQLSRAYQQLGHKEDAAKQQAEIRRLQQLKDEEARRSVTP
jgi:tetratricopeptide (TPR) repeat protein